MSNLYLPAASFFKIWMFADVMCRFSVWTSLADLDRLSAFSHYKIISSSITYTLSKTFSSDLGNCKWRINSSILIFWTLVKKFIAAGDSVSRGP